MSQLAFTFQPVRVHEIENNPASQAILDDNRERLDKVTQRVHEAMLRGIELNPDNFYSIIGAREYRRRFKNLADLGYPVQERSIGGGMKEKFYSQEYINSQK